MRTTYELTPTNIFARATKDGGFMIAAEEGPTKVNMAITEPLARTLRGTLTYALDGDLSDPNEGGFPITQLTKLRKAVMGSSPKGVQLEFPTDEELADVISAYIRLIERVDQASVVK